MKQINANNRTDPLCALSFSALKVFRKAMQGMPQIAVAVFFCLIPVISAEAQVNRLAVTVDGLACPFCAYGVEKKLKGVQGVTSLDIRMNEGTVVLRAEKGPSMDIGQIPQAIRDSGFSPREMRVWVTGTVRRRGQDLLFQYGGPAEVFSLEDMEPALKEKLSGYLDSGDLVEVEGLVEERREGPWSLIPKSVKSIQ